MTITTKKKKQKLIDLNVYKLIAKETQYSNAVYDYDTILFTYASMPDYFNKNNYKMNGIERKFSKSNKLLKEDIFYNTHVAFRKAIDTKASCIIWKVMHLLKDEHSRLLCDTFSHVLPDSIDCSSDDEVMVLGARIEYAFEVFFTRLSGEVVDYINEKKLTELKRKQRSNSHFLYYRQHSEFYENAYGINYRALIDSFRLATEIEKENRLRNKLCRTVYEGFATFLYEYEQE